MNTIVYSTWMLNACKHIYISKYIHIYNHEYNRLPYKCIHVCIYTYTHRRCEVYINI